MSFAAVTSAEPKLISASGLASVTFLAGDASTVYYAVNRDDLKDTSDTGDGSLDVGEAVSITGPTWFRAGTDSSGSDGAAQLSVYAAPDKPVPVDDALSLRRDFGLNPSMNATLLTTKINDAVQAAISAGRPLSLGWEMWPVDDAIVIDGALRLLGSGCRENWGTVTTQKLLTEAAPYAGTPALLGAGIKQTSSGANGVEISCIGQTVDLFDFGVLFEGSHKFLDTGHGITSVLTVASTGGHDHNVTGGQFRGLRVFGHDGDHYGYNFLNHEYNRYDNLRSYGGGGLHFGQQSGKDANGDFYDYGNALFSNFYSATFVGGTAHGYFVDNISGGFQLDYVHHSHIQTWVFSPVTAIGGGVAVPTNAQKNINYNGNVTYHQIEGGDFETNLTNPMCVFPKGQGCRYSNDGQSGKSGVTTIGVTTPVSGTVYGNDTGTDCTWVVPFTFSPASDADATATMQIQWDKSGSYSTVDSATVAAGGPTTITTTLKGFVPAGANAKVVCTNCTVGSAVTYRAVAV